MKSKKSKRKFLLFVLAHKICLYYTKYVRKNPHLNIINLRIIGVLAMFDIQMYI